MVRFMQEAEHLWCGRSSCKSVGYGAATYSYARGIDLYEIIDLLLMLLADKR